MRGLTALLILPVLVLAGCSTPEPEGRVGTPETAPSSTTTAGESSTPAASDPATKDTPAPLDTDEVTGKAPLQKPETSAGTSAPQ